MPVSKTTQKPQRGRNSPKQKESDGSKSPDKDKWVRLAPDTTETCDKTDFGWARDPASKDRCGAQALFIKKSTCGCGQCDMTHRHCALHQVEYLSQELEDERDLKQKLISALRRANKKLDSDELALYHAIGFEVYPKPKAHPKGLTP
jgi:hypothetical protein